MGPAQEMKFKMERQSRNMTTLASFQSDKKKKKDLTTLADGRTWPAGKREDEPPSETPLKSP